MCVCVCASGASKHLNAFGRQFKVKAFHLHTLLYSDFLHNDFFAIFMQILGVRSLKQFSSNHAIQMKLDTFYL